MRQIIIWKRKGGINFNPGYFLPTYEVIYLIAKPDFRLADKANRLGDVWEFPQEMKNNHPDPFPVALIERIISSTYAKIILDPFMGSGTTAVAARNLGRNFVGIDISPEYCDMSERRLSGCQASKNTQVNSYRCSERNTFKRLDKNVHNDGAIGNTLEDLLGISENNLPLLNAAEWELKTQRRNTVALLTLFHLEPSPRALHIADYLVENYGWPHKLAGTKYPDGEKSFRQTLSYKTPRAEASS